LQGTAEGSKLLENTVSTTTHYSLIRQIKFSKAFIHDGKNRIKTMPLDLNWDKTFEVHIMGPTDCITTRP
jgi:hypothetical protein